MLDTRPLLLQSDFPAIHRLKLETLQVNLGYLCNLSCTHCHVNAGPTRTELMDRKTVDLVLEFIARKNITSLDLTGGAPEMNPHFKLLVKEARAMGIEVIDRCNLTILGEPGYEDLAEFLAANKVVITASLPCYMQQNVDKQRGKGVFQESIAVLQLLNSLGYGVEKDDAKDDLILNLVFNPDDLNLPPEQSALQLQYKKELKQGFGIVFNALFTITNMPISRFGGMLLSKGLYPQYLTLLRDNFCADNLKTVMCRSLLSVDYKGFVYDCDFNQMLNLPLLATSKTLPHLSDLLTQDISHEAVAVAEHCYGCAAGQGSSCGGAL